MVSVNVHKARNTVNGKESKQEKNTSGNTVQAEVSDVMGTTVISSDKIFIFKNTLILKNSYFMN